jgi:hypothetical protein
MEKGSSISRLKGGNFSSCMILLKKPPPPHSKFLNFQKYCVQILEFYIHSWTLEFESVWIDPKIIKIILFLKLYTLF